MLLGPHVTASLLSAALFIAQCRDFLLLHPEKPCEIKVYFLGGEIKKNG